MDQQGEAAASAEERPQPKYEVDQPALEAYLDERRSQMSWFLGTWGGLMAAVLVAAVAAAVALWLRQFLWLDTIAQYTKLSPLGLLAIPLGFAVGYAMRYSSNALLERFGYLASGLTLLGCLLMLLFVGGGLIAKQNDSVAVHEILKLIRYPLLAFEEIAALLYPVDFGLYVTAAVIAFFCGFTKIREEELLRFVHPVRRRTR